MTQRTLKLHGTLTIACLGFVASMAACLGDDSTEPPAHDAGTAADHAVTTDSPTVTPDNTSPRPDVSTTPDASMTPDARPDVSVGDGSTMPDGGARDSAPEATTADARDSAPEAARESGPDSNPPVEASPGDARIDQVAEGAAPEAAPPEAAPPEAAPPDAADAGDLALHMCVFFDEAWGIAAPDAGTQCENQSGGNCPQDRGSTWAGVIPNDFLASDGPMFTDCRTSAFFANWTIPDIVDYLNQLTPWTEYLLGCPDPDIIQPPLTYDGLIPPRHVNDTFTTADLSLISDFFILAINQSQLDAGQLDLTPTQVSQIRAQLRALEQGVVNKVTASTYTFSTCTDGGN